MGVVMRSCQWPVLMVADSCERWFADYSEENRRGCRLTRSRVPIGYGG